MDAVLTMLVLLLFLTVSVMLVQVLYSAINL